MRTPSRLAPKAQRTPALVFAIPAACILLHTLLPFASAQSPPPRDDAHWSPPPGSINFGGNEIPVASDIDSTGRVVVAFNVPPPSAFGFGFVFVAEFDTLLANWTVVGGVLRYQVTGARAVVAKPNGDFFVGGNFFEAVNPDGTKQTAIHVARWNRASGRWDNLGGGLDGPVADLDNAPSGSGICAVGSFFEGVNRDGSTHRIPLVGCFDGSQWSTLGGGVTADSPLSQIAVSPDGDVIVHGLQFGTLDSPSAQGVDRGGIARWSAGSWQNLDNGLLTNALSIAAGPGAEVIVSGFDVQVDTPTGAITAPALRFDGSTWSSYDQGLGGINNVFSIHRSGNNIHFANTGRQIYRRSAPDTSWTLIANGTRSGLNPFFTTVATTAAASDELYVGGQFDGMHNPPANAVATSNHARWNGNTWHDMPGTSGSAPPDDIVRASTAVGGTTYGAVFGGSFTTVGPLPAQKLSVFDGGAWQSFGNGVSLPDSASVFAVAASNPYPVNIAATVFVGGDFVEVRQDDGTAVSVSNIAAFSRQQRTWFSLGQGVDGPVYALAYWDGPAIDDEVLYVGGSFGIATNPDGSTVVVNGIARWIVSDNRWEALGDGLAENTDRSPLQVLALDVAHRLPNAPAGTEPHDHDVFVGGRFDAVRNSGGTPVNGSKNIAWFSAREGLWRAVGGGADSTVRALKYIRHPIWPVDSAPHTFNRGVLYAGGDFRVVRQAPGGIVPANHIAKWRIDTNAWDIIGETASANGFNGPVHSLTLHPTLTTARWLSRIGLVVGGDFSTGVGSDGATVAMNNIALLDDGEPLADHPPSFVREAFIALGSGTDGPVLTSVALRCEETFGGETVYVGGEFTTAGGKTTPGLARWSYDIDAQPTQLVVFNGAPGCSNCSSSVTGPAAPSVCGGALSKSAADVDLFTDLAFGETATVSPSAIAGLPLGEPLALELRDQSGTTVAVQDSLFIESRRPTMLFVAGVAVPQSFAPNPGGRPTGLALRTALLPRLAASAAAGAAAVLFYNGVTDAPAVDVLIDGVLGAQGVPFGQPALEPIAVQAGTRSIEVRLSSDNSLVSTWTREMPVGRVALVLSGFMDPSANGGGPGIDLAVVDIEEVTAVGVDEVGDETVAGTNRGGPAIQLLANYPNPFSSDTRIRFSLASRQSVRISVFDAIGREVAVLMEGDVGGGDHAIPYAAESLPAGLYFVVLESGGIRVTRPIVRAR